MSLDLNHIPPAFRTDLEKASAVLRNFGAQEIHVFGSLADPERKGEPRDIDLAVSGLPASVFFRSCGELMGVLDHPFDLIDLDYETPFVRKLREHGNLARVV